MTGRVLVWPWHGRLQNGQIRLANGSFRAHPQPQNSEATLNLFGPGDTHHIKVGGIEPITSAEAALAPPGGQWWAGEALLSGTMLYGKSLDGWIYQGPGYSRWWVKIQGVSVGTSATTGTFRVRRFGVFGGEPDTRNFNFTLSAGRCPPAEAARIGADLGGMNVGYLRLHAVSETGRTAVLALVTRNTGPSNDRRPRSYRFFLASVSGDGESLAISLSELYGIDDIAPQPAPQPDRGFVRLKPSVAEETGREPYLQNGEIVAYDVTYTLDSDSGFEVTTTPTAFTVPGTYTDERRVMLQVRLSGETPVPVYATARYTCTVPWPTLQWVTSRERKRREWLTGGVGTLEEAMISLTGSVSVTAQVEFSVGDWVDQVVVSCSSSVDTGEYMFGSGMPTEAVDNSYVATGLAGDMSLVVPNLPLQYLGPVLFGSFAWGSDTRQPGFNTSIGVPGQLPAVRNYLLRLDLLSNNLLAVSGRIDTGPQSYINAIAAGSAVPYSGAYPAGGLSAFGSYNPVTGDVEIASTPVNWI